MPTITIDIPGRRLLRGTALGLVFSLAATEGAQAACAPGPTGGDDIIVCTGVNAGNLSAGGGNDRVTVSDDGEVQGNITGGTGNDSLWVSFGTVTGSLGGGSGSDTLIVGAGSGAATVSIDISAGDRDDVIYVGTGADIDGRLLGGSGDDTLYFAAGTVGLDILGGAGADRITLSGGSAASDVLGGTGDDIIALAGSTVAGALYGGSGNESLVVTAGTADGIYGGAGDDDVTLAGGSILADIYGSSGNDGITLAGGVLGNDAFGGSGADDITLAGSSVVGDLFGGSGADSFSIVGGSADEVRGSEGGDVLVMSGGSVNRLDGGDQADTLTVSGGTVAGSITGATGSDTLFIGGGATVGDVDGGADGDLIAVSGAASVTGSLFGREGADTLLLSGGSVAGDFYGGDGAEWVTLGGSSVSGSLQGGSGDDTFFILSGTAEGALGGTGADLMVMIGGSLARLVGGSGNDTLGIGGGTVTDSLSGGEGDDTLVIDDSAVAQRVLGGGGADQLDLAGGTVFFADGEAGDDVARVSGSAVIQGGLAGGADADTLFLVLAQSLAGAVSGDEGDDSLFVSGAGAGGGFDGALLSGIDTLAGGAGTGDLLQFDGVTGALPAALSGYETIRLVGGSTLDLHNGADQRSIAGEADVLLGIAAGSLLLADGNSPGDFTLVGSLGSDGTLEMRDGAADDRVFLTGDFGGAGVLGLDAALDASATADLLVIGGAVATVNVPGMAAFTAGGTGLLVSDVGAGPGVLTGTGPGNGIAVIDVSASGGTAAGDFFLLGGPLQKGAVAYDLVLESDGIWYLQSSLLAQVYGYAAAPSAALGMGQDYLGALRERVGTREQSWTGGAVQSSEGGGLWLRGGSRGSEVTPDSGYAYDQDHWFAQVGADVPLWLDPAGPRLVGGLFAHYGTADIETADGLAKGTLDAWGGGVSLTWYAAPRGAEGRGLYADLAGQISAYQAELRGGGAEASSDGWGLGLSLEAGWGFEVGPNLRLIPQARLAYSRVDLQGFTDSQGVAVDYGAADSLEGRAGVALDSGRLWRSGNLTFTAGLVHEFLGEIDAEASGLDIGGALGGTAAEIGLGGTVSLLDNVSLYADLDYRVPLSDAGRESVAATLGLRLSW